MSNPVVTITVRIATDEAEFGGVETFEVDPGFTQRTCAKPEGVAMVLVRELVIKGMAEFGKGLPN